MKWQSILAILVAAPVLALLGGVGVLAYQIGQTWDTRATDSLITGLAVSCGGGAVVLAILLALIVGVPLALRAYERGGMARQAWPDQYRALPPAGPPSWAEQAPMLTDKTMGSWQSTGQAYDLWDDEPAAPAQLTGRQWQ